VFGINIYAFFQMCICATVFGRAMATCFKMKYQLTPNCLL